MRVGFLRRLAPVIAAGWLVACLAGTARTEEYVLGPEDVVSVSVWLHPELERSLTINADGNVTLPPVGEIKAAGLTTKQLSDRIADRLSSYLRQTTTVTVNVTAYNSRSVFVTGSVAKPGRYGFEIIPTIVDVLGQAGGALPGSDLSAVQILRKEGETRRTISADLSNALRTGDTSGLPDLKPGDTIVIPGPNPAGGAVGAVDGVAVLGEVNRPGFYTVGTGQDIWAVLATAGGLTIRGNLGDVRMLSKTDGGQNVTRVNLNDVLLRGSRTPIVLRPGDVLVVMPRALSAWQGFTNVLSLSQNALNAAVLVDYFRTHR